MSKTVLGSKLVQIAAIDILPTPIVREYSSRPFPDEMGEHASTMTLWWVVPAGDTEPDIRNGTGSIEWDIPALDTGVGIGIWTENGEVVDYDGVFGLPVEAAKFLRSQGLTVPEDMI